MMEISTHSRVQIFSPHELAELMATALVGTEDVSRLLDPGAGAGALTEAVLARVASPVTATLVERDSLFAEHLRELIEHHTDKLSNDSAVVCEDFITTARNWVATGVRFTHIIMNPPYARVAPFSSERQLLRGGGIAASNLAAAFLWLGADLLEPGGKVVVVLPRTFLSGPQYRATRRHLRALGSFYFLHHFRDRRAVFGRDAVQQEVVVLGFQRASANSVVRFSVSEGLQDIDEECIRVPASRLVDPTDTDHVIHVPHSMEDAKRGSIAQPEVSYEANVSVGSVVDFRLTEHIDLNHGTTVPLLGSEQFRATPQQGRALAVNDATKNHVFPPGDYVIIKRISPPESALRLQARAVSAVEGNFRLGVAFENHLIVLHKNRNGLAPEVANGLVGLLTSPWAKQRIAERVGGTQINAADVRALLGVPSKPMPEGEEI